MFYEGEPGTDFPAHGKLVFYGLQGVFLGNTEAAIFTTYLNAFNGLLFFSWPHGWTPVPVHTMPVAEDHVNQ